MENLPDIMGTGDVMHHLGVSKQRVYELVRRGKLKARKTSAGIIFLKSDVEAYRRDRDSRKTRQKRR